MLNFDERDLLIYAEERGVRGDSPRIPGRLTQGNLFFSGEGPGWDSSQGPGNPKIPTLEEAMNEALKPEEIERFTAHLRPLVERNEAKGCLPSPTSGPKSRRRPR